MEHKFAIEIQITTGAFKCASQKKRDQSQLKRLDPRGLKRKFTDVVKTYLWTVSAFQGNWTESINILAYFLSQFNLKLLMFLDVNWTEWGK